MRPAGIVYASMTFTEILVRRRGNEEEEDKGTLRETSVDVVVAVEARETHPNSVRRCNIGLMDAWNSLETNWLGLGLYAHAHLITAFYFVAKRQVSESFFFFLEFVATGTLFGILCVWGILALTAPKKKKDSTGKPCDGVGTYIEYTIT